jgi:hypothetical protein
MPAVAPDDLNHLLLSCRMSSELASGVRYAYTRLDIIDRKASENFRSYGVIFALLVGLRSLMNHTQLYNKNGEMNSLPLFIYLVLLVLAVIAVSMALQHKEISSLDFYRIERAKLDESSLQNTPS